VCTARQRVFNFFVSKLQIAEDSECYCGSTAVIYVSTVPCDYNANFHAATAGDVGKVLATMPAKSPPLDVLPSSLLKQCAHVLSPVIARLANLSFSRGLFPQRYQSAQVLSLLKKPLLCVQKRSSCRKCSSG